MRSEEQSEKARSCRENLWNDFELKGYKDRNRCKNRLKKSGQATPQEGEPVGTIL